MFRLCTARPPDDVELEELIAVYNDHRAAYDADTQAASQLIALGESAPNNTADDAELAAWTMVANLVLNLDEVVSKN
jgi:hypothetical protein